MADDLTAGYALVDAGPEHHIHVRDRGEQVEIEYRPPGAPPTSIVMPLPIAEWLMTIGIRHGVGAASATQKARKDAERAAADVKAAAEAKAAQSAAEAATEAKAAEEREKIVAQLRAEMAAAEPVHRGPFG